MSLNIGIIILLILPSLILTEDMADKSNSANVVRAKEVFLIIGIILATAIVTFSTIAFIYFTLRCIKRKLTEPQYYIDDFSSTTSDHEYNDRVNNLATHIPNLNQIQPSLSIPHMASSVKQSLVDLRDCFLPVSWSQNQRIYYLEKPVNEKPDLPI